MPLNIPVLLLQDIVMLAVTFHGFVSNLGGVLGAESLLEIWNLIAKWWKLNNPELLSWIKRKKPNVLPFSSKKML